MAEGNCTAESVEVSEQDKKVVNDLSEFLISRILSHNAQRKTICALGKLAGRGGNAILFLEKLPFSEDTFRALCSKQSALKKEFSNDIYGNYFCFPDVDLNYLKTTLIYPATDKHVAKYESSPTHIIEETPDLYHNVTLPHITKDQFNLQWVYNILEHKKEVERIVFEDDDPEKGFVLVPDLKWDGSQVETLYLIAIVRCHDIKSLRDLDNKHLPLLRNIKDKGEKAIFEKYGLQKSQLRLFIHYQPSFYHLHVHFTYLSFEAPGIFAEKSHLLSTVINNIELNSYYYQLATVPFVVHESQSLFSAYEEKGLISRGSVSNS